MRRKIAIKYKNINLLSLIVMFSQFLSLSLSPGLPSRRDSEAGVGLVPQLRQDSRVCARERSGTGRRVAQVRLSPWQPLSILCVECGGG